MFEAAAIQVVENHWHPINRSLSPSSLTLSLFCFSRPCCFSTVLLPLYALDQSHVVKDTYSDMCTSAGVTHVFWLLSSFAWVLWSQREGGNPAGLDACDWLPGVVMSFHRTSATSRMTCRGVAGWGQGYKNPTKCKTSSGCAWSENHLVE